MAADSNNRMGKRSRNRRNQRNGRNTSTLKNHHNASNKFDNPLPIKRQAPSFKHTQPQRDLHTPGKPTESVKKDRGHNKFKNATKDLFKSSSSSTTNKNRTSGETFSSRKRSLAQIEFVYPKKNGVKEPYNFEKSAQKNNEKSLNGVTSAQQSQPDETSAERNFSSKSIDDILYSNGKKTTFEESSGNEKSNGSTKLASDDDTSGSGDGKLSGRSVEDAVKDRVGCRPRSNSTDGELNLPQRGLCDERSVLESYRWRFDRYDIGNEKPKGFNNMGNTCFLNSTLQCLAHIPPFCQSLMAMPANGSQNNGAKGLPQGKRLTLMAKNLFSRVHSGNASSSSSIAPRAIVDAVPALGNIGSRGGYRFRPGRQEDCHEFLGMCCVDEFFISFTNPRLDAQQTLSYQSAVHFLDAMNDGELRDAGINQHKSGWRDRLPIPRLDETTFVHRIFGGYFRSQVRCTRCEYKSNTYDPFLDLSLEVSKKSCNSILDALKEFTRKEKLDNENKWKCSGCNKHVCAIKQLTVFRPPLVLCIQLKRFAYAGGFGGYGGFMGGKKISKPIDFPSLLKLPLSDNRSCEYTLTGIVVHLGGSATSGHYTACIKKTSLDGKEKWFHMDDSFVEPISEKAVLQQKDAYLLFYCRREVKIEYPTPPLRGSMSAEEATELGRARSLARGQKGSTSTREEEVETKPTAVETLANETARPDRKSDVSNCSNSTESPNFRKKPESSVSGSEDSSATNSGGDPELNRTVASHGRSESETRDEETQSKKERVENPAVSEFVQKNGNINKIADSGGSNGTGKSDLSKPASPPVSDQHKVKHDTENRKETVGNGEQHGAIDSSSSSGSDSSESSSESSSSEDEESSSSGEPESPNNLTAKGSSGQSSDHGGQGDVSSEKRNPKTKISLDFAKGREKVSVMLGPRFRGRSWTPGTVTAPKGRAYDLLGNVAVGKWGEDDGDDDDDGEDDVSKISEDRRRSAILRSISKEEKSRKKRMFLDGWDSALDRGKKKKVKGETAKMTSRTEAQNHRFQKIQASVQNMNRGRPKGFFRTPGGSKNKGGR